jgi:hypothetical protein
MLTAVAQRARATLTFVMPTLAAPPPMFPSSTGTTLTGGATPSVSSAGVSVMSAPLIASLFVTLARDSGGSILPVGATTDLSAAFRRGLDEFRSAYVLYYNARDVDHGGYHVLEVKVKRDGASVQARRGYFSR